MRTLICAWKATTLMLCWLWPIPVFSLHIGPFPFRAVILLIPIQSDAALRTLSDDLADTKLYDWQAVVEGTTPYMVRADHFCLLKSLVIVSAQSRRLAVQYRCIIVCSVRRRMNPLVSINNGKRINLARFRTNDDVFLGRQIRRSTEASCLRGDYNSFYIHQNFVTKQNIMH